MSRDPFRGVMERASSRNGYSWVEGRVVNAVDPSGMIAIDIWVAAFIAPASLDFPYFGYDDGDILYDGTATWHGDNRGFYTGGQSKDYHPSSRVWHQVHIDTNYYGYTPVQSRNTSNQDTGVTSVTVNRIMQPDLTVSDKEDVPLPAWIRILDESTILVNISANSGNPVMPSLVTPPIIYNYSFVFDLEKGQVSITGQHSYYPWHEVVIQVDQQPIYTYHRAPDGIFGSGYLNNPGSLFVGARRHISETISDDRLIENTCVFIPPSMN